MEGQDRGRQTWKRASSPGRRTAVARRARPMRAARTAPGTATRPRSCAEIWESSRSWEGPLGGSEEQDLGSAPRGAELSYAPASASELRSFGDKAQLLCFHRRHSKLPASHTARPQGTSKVPVLTAAKQKQDAPQTCGLNVFTPASLVLRAAGASQPYFDTNRQLSEKLKLPTNAASPGSTPRAYADIELGALAPRGAGCPPRQHEGQRCR